jgi:hypothetical protein
MSYVPNSAMHHAVAEPDELGEIEQADRAGSRWWVAGSIGLGLAIAAPGIVGLLRARDARRSRRAAGKSPAATTRKPGPRAAAKPRRRVPSEASPTAAAEASARGRTKRPGSGKAGKAAKPA